MKIRQGFVSNSSSSSFLIYGIEIDQEQLDLLFTEEEMEDGFYEYLEDFNRKNKTQISYHDYEDKQYLGVDIKCKYEGDYCNFSIFEKDLVKYKEQLEQDFNKLFGENSKDFLKHAAIYGGTYFS